MLSLKPWRKRIYRVKYALLVSGRIRGGKNGRNAGMRCKLAQNVATVSGSLVVAQPANLNDGFSSDDHVKHVEKEAQT